MKFIKNYTFIFGLLVLFATSSCRPTFDDPKYDRGMADFTSYVAFGNSLTAGYADNALYVEGQKNSYPAMLAKQFRLVGNNGIFRIPLIDSANAVRGVNPSPVITDPFRTSCKYVLGFSTGCNNSISLGPVPYAPFVGANNGFFTNIHIPGSFFNNVGVPDIKSFQIDNPQVANLSPTNPLYNPYYSRFASAPLSSTILSDGLNAAPTFFTFWLGNNDVLGYATSGGATEPAPAVGMNSGQITPLDTFKHALSNAINKLIAVGAKGCIANIPDVTDIPFFTTVPYNGLNLTTQAEVDLLNAAYSGTNITFSLGKNPFIVADASDPNGFRKIKPDEFICLTIPQDSIKCAHWGSVVPIADRYWLDKTEIAEIKAKTTEFNAHIQSLADAHPADLALVDFNSYFKTVAKGIVFNGVSYGPEFVSGGAFSLDGIHPNQRGYALVANQYIRAINARFNSIIPEVDVNSYPGIVFP